MRHDVLCAVYKYTFIHIQSLHNYLYKFGEMLATWRQAEAERQEKQDVNKC